MNALHPSTQATRPLPRCEVPIPEWTDDDSDDVGLDLVELFGARRGELFDA